MKYVKMLAEHAKDGTTAPGIAVFSTADADWEDKAIAAFADKQDVVICRSDHPRTITLTFEQIVSWTPIPKSDLMTQEWEVQSTVLSRLLLKYCLTPCRQVLHNDSSHDVERRGLQHKANLPLRKGRTPLSKR
jgi:hypothetical protein